MALTPLDVQKKTFSPAFKGYAPDEVDDFLDDVVLALNGYEERLNSAEDRIAALMDEVSASRETEQALRRTLVAAQRTADEIVADARKEAEDVLTAARTEAAEIANGERRRQADLIDHGKRLEAAVEDLRGRLRVLSEGTLDQLEQVGQDVREAHGVDFETVPSVEEPEVVAEVDSENDGESAVDDTADADFHGDEHRRWNRDPEHGEPGHGEPEHREPERFAEQTARRPWERDGD
jgi:cell division initiation protein